MHNKKSRVQPDISSDRTQNRKSASEKTRSPWGLRIEALLDGKPQTWLAEQSGVPISNLNDIVRKSMPAADTAIKIAQALGRSTEFVFAGIGPATASPLLAVDDADWVQVPRYRLADFTETGKGPPVETVPIRKDWLNRNVRRTRNLWFTELPTSKFKGLGEEGDIILCYDLELREGEGYYLYFYDGAPLVRHFVLPDAAEPPGALAFDEDPPLMRIAARILGQIGLKPV